MDKKSLHTSGVANSSEQFEGIYKTNQPLIYRFMFWRTKDEMLAQDLTNDVFAKAWKTRGSFTGGSSKAWLYRIARTTLIDHWRKNREVLDDRDIIARAPSAAPTIDAALDREISLNELRKALVKLPKNMHEVVELRFIQGKSARQTAIQLNISEANVRIIQYRALRKLRKYLG